MLKKYISITLLVFFLVPFLISSCSQTTGQANEQNVTSEETAIQEQETAPSEPASNETEQKEEAGIDLETLQELENNFKVINAFPNLSFTQPLDFQIAGDGSGRMFIVEKSGRISAVDGNAESELFLDISDQVNDSGGEEGLLGLAFHPDFKKNGYFFVNYTNNNGTVVSRFKTIEGNPDKADPESEEIVITFDQPYSNHNGGKLAFGPDGYLYISTGDGGGAGDPQGNAQNPGTLLGKILRIDIDNQQTGHSYAIPPDNPFAGNSEGRREEIYAYGLRNPWRFSFDPVTGNLWAADVGQNKIEEIDLIEKGGNYGWNIMEGSQCFNPPSGCDTKGLTLPIYEYEHPLGKSITGGYVYRGNRLPILQGIYIYADFVTGYIWGLAYNEGEEARNFTLAETNLNISSFGIDENQELYLTAFDGNIYKLTLP
ncbi:MAG: PQQ-dependent sugar dehydrogenase [Actinomycetota bacterium]